jgi:hypothetical protein
LTVIRAPNPSSILSNHANGYSHSPTTDDIGNGNDDGEDVIDQEEAQIRAQCAKQDEDLARCCEMLKRNKQPHSPTEIVEFSHLAHRIPPKASKMVLLYFLNIHKAGRADICI